MEPPSPKSAPDSSQKTGEDFDGRPLSRRMVIWLLVLVIMSLVFHMAYVEWVNPYNRGKPLSQGVFNRQGDENLLGTKGDETSYYQIAINLMSSRGYSATGLDKLAEPTAYRPPLFPSLLAIGFRLFGASLKRGLILNQVFVVLLIPLAFLLGSLLCNSRCGIIAAILVAFWPHGFFFGSFLLTEPLFALLQLITFGLLVKFALTPSPYLAAAAGIAAAGSFLSRTSFSFILACIGLWFLWLPQKRRKWRLAMVFFGSFLFGVSPWILRNLVVMKAFIPGTTGSGVVFAGAHNQDTLTRDLGKWIEPKDPAVPHAERMTETEKDAYYWKLGFSSLSHRPPGLLLKVIVAKVIRLWVPLQRIVEDRVCSVCNILMSIPFSFIFFISFIGLWWYRSHREVVLLAVAFLAGTTLESAVFWGTSRFRMPVEPILWIFASLAMMRLGRTKKSAIIPSPGPQRT